MKATKVDGVYDKDPHKYKDARMFRRLTYLDVLNKNLGVMDSTAISLCRDNNLPILVFNMTKPGNIRRVVLGEPLGTLVLDERRDPRLGPAARTIVNSFVGGKKHGERHHQEPAGRHRQGDRGVPARARQGAHRARQPGRSSTACASTTTARRRR